MKKQILLLTGLGCLLYTVASRFAAPTPIDTEKRRQDSLWAVRLEKIAAFRATYPNIQIQTNSVTGAPKDIWGDLSRNQSQSDPVEATYEFFEQNKELYGVRDPRLELKIERIKKNNDPGHPFGPLIVLKQVYKGVDVYQSMIKVNFNRFGKLLGVSGEVATISGVSATPSIDSSSAIETASRDVNFKRTKVDSVWWQAMGLVGKIPSATLAILPLGREYHLVWIVKIEMAIPRESWEHFIDANSGQIVQRLNHRRLDGRVPLQQMVPEKPRRD